MSDYDDYSGDYGGKAKKGPSPLVIGGIIAAVVVIGGGAAAGLLLTGGSSAAGARNGTRFVYLKKVFYCFILASGLWFLACFVFEETFMLFL